MTRPRRQYPSLRRWLIELHFDLLSIHNVIDPYSGEYPDQLTTFERLVITLEDRRFFKHMGVDWRGFIREMLKAATFRKHGGASTIDMQLVRTATGYRDRKIRRKIYEAFLAYIIQHRYSKIQILRSYLQIAYFGSNMKGSEKASYKLFELNALQLDVKQAASLAAMLVFPRPRSPNDDWIYRHSRRANYIESVYFRSKNRFDKLEKRIFS